MKKIQIKGQIVSNEDSEFLREYLGIEATSPRDIELALEEADGEDVEVTINSGGGSVIDGTSIYHALNTYEGNVTINIVGLAGSIASVIAMSGNKVRISPTSLLMIHNVSIGGISGDYNDMDRASEMLKSANQSIASAYQIKTGMEESELLDLMNKETWLSSKKALELGFVDEIINDNGVLSNKNTILSNSVGVNILNQEAIQNLKNKLISPKIVNKKEVDDDSDIFMEQNKLKAKLKLLKLKGEI